MDSIRPETSCEAPFPVDRPVSRGLGYFFSLISLVLFALALALPLTGCGGGVSEEEEEVSLCNTWWGGCKNVVGILFVEMI